MTHKNKARWVQSLASFLLGVAFLLILPKLTTPVQGAFFDIASVVLAILAYRLIEHWQRQTPQAQQSEPNAPARQDIHV